MQCASCLHDVSQPAEKQYAKYRAKILEYFQINYTIHGVKFGISRNLLSCFKSVIRLRVENNRYTPGKLQRQTSDYFFALLTTTQSIAQFRQMSEKYGVDRTFQQVLVMSMQ